MGSRRQATVGEGRKEARFLGMVFQQLGNLWKQSPGD